MVFAFSHICRTSILHGFALKRAVEIDALRQNNSLVFHLTISTTIQCTTTARLLLFALRYADFSLSTKDSLFCFKLRKIEKIDLEHPQFIFKRSSINMLNFQDNFQKPT